MLQMGWTIRLACCTLWAFRIPSFAFFLSRVQIFCFGLATAQTHRNGSCPKFESKNQQRWTKNSSNFQLRQSQIAKHLCRPVVKVPSGDRLNVGFCWVFPFQNPWNMLKIQATRLCNMQILFCTLVLASFGCFASAFLWLWTIAFSSFSYIFVRWLEIFHGHHQIVSKSKSSIVSWTPAGWHRIFLRANWHWKLCCYRLPSGLGVSANLRVSWAQEGSLEIASSLFLFYFWDSTRTSMAHVLLTVHASTYKNISKTIRNPLLVFSLRVLDEGECQEVCSQRSPGILRRPRCVSTFYLWILRVWRTFVGDSSLFLWMILFFSETWKRHQGNRQNWNCIPKIPGRQRPAFRVLGDKKLSNHNKSYSCKG